MEITVSYFKLCRRKSVGFTVKNLVYLATRFELQELEPSTLVHSLVRKLNFIYQCCFIPQTIDWPIGSGLFGGQNQPNLHIKQK